MAQKLYCSQGRHLGRGRASQPGDGAGAVLMAPEVEDEMQEAEADSEHVLLQMCVSSRTCMSQKHDNCNILHSIHLRPSL